MPLTRMHEDIIIASIEIYIDDIVENEVLTPEQKNQALSLMIAPAVTAEATAGLPPDIVEDIKAINHIYNHECPQNASESGAYFDPRLLAEANRNGEVIYEPNGHGRGTVREKKGLLNLTRHGGGNPTRNDVREFIEKFINTKAQQIKLSRVHPASLAAQVTQVFSTIQLRRAGAPLSDDELIRQIGSARLLKTLIPTLVQHRQRPSVRQYVAENIEQLSERLKADPQSSAQFFMTSYITDILNQKSEIFYSLIREYAKNIASFKLLCDEMQRIKTENNKHYLALFAFRVALLAKENANVAINVLLNQNIFEDYLTANDIVIMLENHKTDVNFIRTLLSNAAFRDIMVKLAEQDVKIANNLLRILKPYTRTISGDTFAQILQPHIVFTENLDKLFDELDDDFKKILLFKAGRYSPLVAFYATEHFSKQMQELLGDTRMPSSEIKRFKQKEEEGRKLVANQSAGVTSAATYPTATPAKYTTSPPVYPTAYPRLNGGSSAASPAAAPPSVDYGSVTKNKACIKTLLNRYFEDLQKKNLNSISFQALPLSELNIQNTRFGNLKAYTTSVYFHLEQAKTLDQLKYLLSNILSTYDILSQKKIAEIISPEITQALKEHLQAIESRLRPTVTSNHGMRP